MDLKKNNQGQVIAKTRPPTAAPPINQYGKLSGGPSGSPAIIIAAIPTAAAPAAAPRKKCQIISTQV